MNCKWCGGSLSPADRCTVCGSANGTADLYIPETTERGSIRLTIFMTMIMVIDAVLLLICLIGFFTENTPPIVKVSSGIGIVTSAFDILLCVFILRLKKWALNVFIAFAVISAVPRIMAFDFISVGFKFMLLYLIFKHDWDKFK